MSKTITSKINILALVLGLALLVPAPGHAAGLAGDHGAAYDEIPSALPFEVVAAGFQTFSEPLRTGSAPGDPQIHSAFTLALEMDEALYQSLPPSMEAFLYVGSREVRIHSVGPGDRRGQLLLTFHLPSDNGQGQGQGQGQGLQAAGLQVGAPLVLTLEHGGPVRTPDRFLDRSTPTLRESWTRQPFSTDL